MEERLQKILSQWGIASRRQAEEMIRLERVEINGVLAHLGQKVDAQRDIITVDGKPLKANLVREFIYLLLNKPTGVVSTCSDPQQRRTILDLLPKDLQQGQGLHPVGRLDSDSTGALIITNDGELTFRLTHPSYSIPKTYRVLLEGHPSREILEMWRQGVVLEGRKTRPAQVRILETLSTQTSLEIILKEGRNRQIRRVAQQLGYPVIKLHRTAIGQIKLTKPGITSLPLGNYRHLSDDEIRYLLHQIKPLTSTY